MNPIAQELNAIIERANPHVLHMLSHVGKELFFPKGILSQSAEAKEKAYRFNATIGIATEKGRPMCLPSITQSISGIPLENSMTYAPSFGVPALRRKWREALFEKNPSLRGKSISLPIVTQAITHGLALVGEMWVDPGDVVVLPDKMWGNYNMVLSVRRGARVSQYPMFTERGGFHLEAFERKIREEAAACPKIIVLLNFPNNPTGYTATAEEGEAIARILGAVADAGTRVITVLDDAYFGLFYEQESMKESLFGRLCSASPRLLAIKLDGATKEDFVWGLRIGFLSYGAQASGDPAPLYDSLEKKTAGAVRGTISNASHLSQSICLRSMESPTYREEKQAKCEILKKRALTVRKVLSDAKYRDAWDVYPFNSGYFMCLKLKTTEAEPLRLHLLDRYGVGCIALGKTDLRIAFSCIEEENIAELFDCIHQGITDMEGQRP